MKIKLAKRKTRLKVIAIEEVYRLINRVQTAYKEVAFSMSFEEAAIAENVLKDASLEYVRNDLKTKVNFLIHPPPEREEEDDDDLLLDIDLFDDEVLEDGQIF